MSNCAIREPQQTVTIALSLAATKKKVRNVNFNLQTLELQSASSSNFSTVRLFQSCGTFILQISKESLHIEGIDAFKGTPDRCKSTFLCTNYKEIVTLENRRFVLRHKLLCLNKPIVNTLLVTLETLK